MTFKTKSKNSMATRGTIFPDVVVKKIFPLLSVGWYLFTLVSRYGYLTRGSNGNAHSITMNGNASVSSWVIPLVTKPFLDFVVIH